MFVSCLWVLECVAMLLCLVCWCAADVCVFMVGGVWFTGLICFFGG